MLQIPGYEIREEIGESSKSSVYRGYSEIDKKDVILKISRISDAASTKEYKHEYDISRHLDIAGVVKIYRIEEFQDGIALIMEDFGGISLKKIIIAKTIDLPGFLKLAVKLISVIGTLHEHSIIHGDIKPSNIIVNIQTGELKISDFSYSYIFDISNLNKTALLPGTLSYMSPEQTGRINKPIDYRTDFYSLGVTLYEMITCRLPFTSTDPIELIYCHIAKIPAAPASDIINIPKVISGIIMKLLSKNPEDRYQSAYAIKHDLEECLSQLANCGVISDFAIAGKDIPEWLNIPNRIYGRDAEKMVLGNIFERITMGFSEMVLISGYAGVGKTALIEEVFSPVLHRDAFFIEGKYEQFKQDMPYSGIIQAFRSLIKMLLTEKKDKLELWKNNLLNSFGINGQAVVNVIPEIELIVGKLPAIPSTGPLESRNIFNNVFQELFKVFSSEEHPLVIFLDDLQHADLASLSLLETIITGEDINNFLFVGSYRDDEVDDHHPLKRMIENVRKAGIVTTSVQLKPLTINEVNNWVSDILSAEKEKSLELSKCIIEKTAGNAFFVIFFIKKLYHDHILKFNSSAGGWEWDIEKVLAIGFTDNVIDLLVERLNSMPADVRNVLSLASCIGTVFNPSLIMLLLNTPIDTTLKLIHEASKDGFLIPVRNSNISAEGNSEDETTVFRFSHDRILEASYSLLSLRDIQLNHLKIARILLEKTTRETIDESIFEIISHYHKGIDLIKDETEKRRLAEYSLMAGKKAKSTTAYQAACNFIKAGLSVLPENIWKTDYKFAYDIHRELSECEYLAGNHQKAEDLFDLTLQQSRTNIDKAEIFIIWMVLYANIGKFSDNIRLCIEALKLFDIVLPDAGDHDAMMKCSDEFIDEYKSNLGDTKIEDLFNLPAMNDPEKRVCLKLIASSLSSAYVSNPDFFAAASLKGINITLQYGMTEDSISVFAFFGIFAGIKFNDYKSGYDYTALAIRLNEKWNSRPTKSTVPFTFGNFINHWRNHIRYNMDYLREAYKAGMEIGDYVYSSFSAMSIARVSLSYGHDNLHDLQNEIENSLLFLKRIKNFPAVERQELNHHVVLNLLGLTKNSLSFNSDIFDENRFLEKMRSINYGTGIGLFYLYKAETCYLFHEYSAALDYSEEAIRDIPFMANMMQESDCIMFNSLILTAMYPSAGIELKNSRLETIKKNQARMAMWRENCAENFTCRYLLVEAETARITGDYIRAAGLYEQAAASAKQNEFIFMAGLCYERASIFYLENNIQSVAGIYINKALHYYKKWGADGKVKHIEEKYSGFIAQHRDDDTFLNVNPKANDTGTDSYKSNIAEIIDITSILKASQAISGEILFNRMIDTLMRIVLENAGAQSGFLVIENDETIIVEAESDSLEVKHITVRTNSDDSFEDYPHSIISYVKRTGEEVLLNDATSEGIFKTDPYIIKKQPLSVLCIPITEQTKIAGILYLENRIIKNAFTAERIRVLSLLSSQAAISIQNSLNYEEINRTKDELQKSKEKLQESLGNYLNLFENVQDMFYRVSIDGKLILVSPSVKKIMGYTPDEIINRDLKDFYKYPEQRNNFLELISKKGFVEDFEIQLNKKDGSVIWVSTNSHYFYDKDGKVSGIEGMIRDITARKVAEEMLLDEKERLSVTLKSISDGVIAVDIDKQIVLINKMAENLTGWTQDEAAGHDLDKVFKITDLNSQEQFVDFFPRVLDGEMVELINNIVLIDRNGLEHSVENSVAPIRDKDSKIVGAIIVFRDISERRKLELEILKNQKLESIGIFAGGIAHDFNNILTGILGNISLAKIRVKEDQRIINNLNEAENAAIHARGLTQQLLTFSKGGNPVKKTASIVELLMQSVKFILSGSKIKSEFSITPDTWPVDVDEGQINQVINNLIINSIQAMPDGGVIHINIENTTIESINHMAMPEGQYVKISIRDEGIGIPRDNLSKIFDPFFTTKAAGNGLGLATSYAIIKKHDGFYRC